jgi:hypothetical protein
MTVDEIFGTHRSAVRLSPPVRQKPGQEKSACDTMGAPLALRKLFASILRHEDALLEECAG